MTVRVQGSGVQGGLVGFWECRVWGVRGSGAQGFRLWGFGGLGCCLVRLRLWAGAGNQAVGYKASCGFHESRLNLCRLRSCWKTVHTRCSSRKVVVSCSSRPHGVSSRCRRY